MQASNTKTWVPASGITMVTGWGKQKLMWARKHNVLKFRPSEEKKSYQYLLESIPSQYLLTTAAK